MSVLFKALQKAEKENEQRQTPSGGTGFDAGRLAGSGAIKLAGGQGINWRTAGLAAAGVLAVAITGAFFLIQTPEAPSTNVTAVKTTTVTAVAPGMTESIPVLQPPAGAPAVVAATQQAAVAEQPEATMAAAPAAASSPPTVSPSPVMATTPATPSGAPPEAVVAAVAPGAPGPVAAPVAAAPPAAAPPPEKPAVTQVAKAAPAVSKPSVAAVPTPRRDPAADIAVDSPARMLSPPIAIHRAEFELSGVGKAVQVREVSQSAQDNVSAGYNALVRGAYDMALGFYDRALKSEPTSVLALLGHGAALQKLGKPDEARADYERVLKVDPANREALSNLTVIVGERSSAEALNQLLDLEKQYPGFSPVKAQIGLTYAKLGSMDKAYDYLSRAVTMTPEAVMYQYNLALVLDHLGRADQAASAYQTVLDSLAGGRGAPELSAADIERRVRYLKAR